MLEFKSVKTQLILYLVCFAVFLAVNEKNATLLVALIIAVAASLTVESIILYFKTKFFQITESSIITGLIIGFVLFSYESWWKLIVASVLAIIFKYLIRLQRKHIFNPAGLGIFLTLIFFGASSQWKGTYFWQIILPFGLYFSYKLKKIGTN